MKRINLPILIFIFFLAISCTGTEDLKILQQTSGPYQTNCYLIYGKQSKEAALIDPGWEIDTLVSFIRDNGLELKYIFITHGHSDHYFYVPELKRQFPGAEWCLHREDYEKIIKLPDWELKAYGREWMDHAMKNPETARYLDFDKSLVGVPDIFVEGNQTFRLGRVEIKTLHTPGHSPGSICFYTKDILFSGDALFYRSVGKLDRLTSNTESFIKSVREIYRLFPDSTLVYPGHNQYTNIGMEKKENRRISLDGGEYDVK